jgi:hypothetical protein
MSGYDIGVSVSTSSGAQGGTAGTGDFILGGSGGANKAPAWLWMAAGVIAVLALFAWMLKK